MLAIATDVIHSVVCVSVCWSRPWDLENGWNWL